MRLQVPFTLRHQGLAQGAAVKVPLYWYVIMSPSECVDRGVQDCRLVVQ